MKYFTLIMLFVLNQSYGQRLYPLELTKNSTDVEAITVLNLSSTNQLLDSTIYNYDLTNRITSEIHFDRTEKKKEIKIDYQEGVTKKSTTIYRQGKIANRYKENYSNGMITQLEFFKDDKEKIVVHYLRDKYLNLYRKEHYLDKRLIREEVITNIYSKEYETKFENIDPIIPLTNMVEEYQLDLILYNFTELENIKALPDHKNTSKHSLIGDTIFIQNFEDDLMKSKSKLIQQGKFEDHELTILKGEYEIITNQKIYPDSLVYSYTTLKANDSGLKSLIQVNKMTETPSFNLNVNTIYNPTENKQVREIKYEYEYDNRGNWTLRIKKENGEVTSSTRRIIKYHE